MANKVLVDQSAPALPVHRDPDVLAAATRMAGEDLCSIADLSSGEVRAILKLGHHIKGNPRAVTTPRSRRLWAPFSMA